MICLRAASRLSVPIAALGLAAFPAFAAVDANDAQPPPLPLVQSVTMIGTVQQNPVINGRDGTQSALFQGKSIWTFGDTSMSVPGQGGDYWADDTLSWTTDLDASDGVTLDHDHLDATGAPTEFLPHTAAELHYNYVHNSNHCTANPCGAELALWPGEVVADPDRNRVLFFYGEIWRLPGRSGWVTIGNGIATWTPGGRVVRPIENPGSPTPTLMWGPHEVAYTSGSVVSDGTLYSYGCSVDWIVMDCYVARVALAHALDKSQWTYYAGNGNWSVHPTAAVAVFQGDAAGNSVFYDAYLGEYVLIYSQPLSDDVMYRVSETPWGPWSDAGLLFTGETGYQGNIDYAGGAHPEFSQMNGQIQYVTYAHSTGFLQSDLPLMQVVFAAP
ncbi:MAG: DUF4185 domain-containing protein [Gammaproteobacteria bacterium]